VQLGGDFDSKAEFIRYVAFPIPAYEGEHAGFRVVRVPEPGHALLLLSAGLVLAASRLGRQRKT